MEVMGKGVRMGRDGRRGRLLGEKPELQIFVRVGSQLARMVQSTLEPGQGS